MQLDGGGQESDYRMTISKPYIPRDGNPYYNHETYTNSQLNNYGKRSMIRPDNFIGFKSLRSDNMFPNRQHIPSGLVWDPIKQGIPILQTTPIQKSYH